jgi:hypothetical protein
VDHPHQLEVRTCKQRVVMTENAWRSRNWQGYLVPAQGETTFHRVSTGFLHYNM